MFTKKMYLAIDIWIKFGWFLPVPMMEGNQRINLTGGFHKLYLAFRFLYGFFFILFNAAFLGCIISSFYWYQGFSPKKILFLSYFILVTGTAGIFVTTFTMSNSLLTQKILHLDAKFVGNVAIYLQVQSLFLLSIYRDVPY